MRRSGGRRRAPSRGRASRDRAPREVGVPSPSLTGGHECHFRDTIKDASFHGN
jgi:hypothetical protein